ncbi:MAG: hypothetical protein H6822_26650 [Planctomycetaceae bacterium]|nr:hypothetical protein [Planctomycetales bacterium]MCB9925759.1 hypothetical protein [Planctomycetaceae bacterium]
MVELRPAFSWDCPECGVENFCRGIVPEFSEEDAAELRDEHGINAWESGDFVMQPETVACAKCAVEFRSLHYKDA